MNLTISDLETSNSLSLPIPIEPRKDQRKGKRRDGEKRAPSHYILAPHDSTEMYRHIAKSRLESAILACASHKLRANESAGRISKEGV